MLLYLVRHGETEENVAHIVQGHNPGHLTENGKRQAQDLAEKLKSESFDRIYCSDLKRTRDTAAYLIKYYPSVPIEYTYKLREISFGSFQGKPASDIDWESIPGDFYTNRPGDGETSLELSERVIDFTNEVYMKNPDAKVLFITHGGPMRVIKASIEKTPLDKLIDRKIGNTEIWSYEISGKLTYNKRPGSFVDRS